MKKKQKAFTINTLNQAEIIIAESKVYKFIPILHFKNYILRGFGPDFIIKLRKILFAKFGKSTFKLYVDCGFDNNLSINMITHKIDYIKLKGNKVILKKIKNIANKNKVLLNPLFIVVDCRNRKNITSKIKEIYTKEKNEN